MAAPHTTARNNLRNRKNVEKISALFAEGMRLSTSFQSDAAIAIYNKVLRLEPGNTEALFQKSVIFSRRQEYTKALHFLRRCAQSNPNDAHLNYVIAIRYYLIKRTEAANRHLRTALEIQPNHMRARVLLSKICAESGEVKLGQALLSAIGAIPVDQPLVAIDYASTLAKLGLVDKAKHVLLNLLDRGQMVPACLDQLTRLPAQHWNSEISSEIVNLLEDQLLSNEDRILLCFAAGRIADHEKKFDTAFRYFAEAGRLYNSKFDIVRYKATVDGLIKAFPKKIGSRTEHKPSPGPSPVFLVGMPRAGKSLVEHALGRHPAVVIAGEVTLRFFIDEDIFVDPGGRLSDNFHGKLPNLTSKKYKNFARDYLQEFTKNNHGAENVEIITNTLPGNFQHIGVILSIFPNAKFIHVRRNPLDVCLFSFIKHFGKKYFYTNDLETLGTYYKYYEKLMAHWKKISGPRIFEIDYEDFVTQPERVTHSVLTFLELHDGDSAPPAGDAAEPLRLKGPDGTPINDSQVGYWKNYEKHLAPLQRALG